MTGSGRQLIDATAAVLFGRSHVRRHLVLRHPVAADRVRWLLLLAERRSVAAADRSADATSR